MIEVLDRWYREGGHGIRWQADVADGHLVSNTALEAPIQALAWSPEAGFLATAGVAATLTGRSRRRGGWIRSRRTGTGACTDSRQ